MPTNKPCLNSACPKYDTTQHDNTNCIKRYEEHLTSCPRYIPEPPKEVTELTLSIPKLSTKQLEEVIVNSQYSLWFRKEALIEHDKREGLDRC